MENSYQHGPARVQDENDGYPEPTWDAETVSALNGSIAKWEKRAAGEIKSPCVSDCPLCTLYYWAGKSGCWGCPVAAVTGEKGCQGTPCHRYHIALERAEEIDASGCGDVLAQIAKEEVEFLKSLLPTALETKGESGV